MSARGWAALNRASTPEVLNLLPPRNVVNVGSVLTRSLRGKAVESSGLVS